MALDTTVFDTDLANVIADNPSTLIWSGETVSCMKGDIARSDEVELAGVFQDKNLEVQVRVGAFANNYPAIRDTLSVDGAEYRVLRSMKSADDIMLSLNLERLTA